jgi:hypothetical protein
VCLLHKAAKLCYAAYCVTRSTNEERVSSSRQLTHRRTPRCHLMSLRSRLGKAAAIGGRAYVERVAASDEFAAIFCHGLDPKSRKAAIDMVVRIADRTRADPPPRKAPSRDERVKIRWTDQLIQQFVAEAPRSSDDFDLCRRLGLPSYCRGAMRAARSRHGLLRGCPKDRLHSPARTASAMAPLPVAA